MILWDVEKRKRVKVYSGHLYDVNCCFFDGETIVTGSSDKTIKIWNIDNTEPIDTYTGLQFTRYL